MATLTLKGVNETLRTNAPSSKIPAGEQHGKVHFAYDEYSWSTNSVIGDVVTLMTLPKGARVIDAIIQGNDHGSAGQYDVGYAASAELDSAGVTVEAGDDDAFFNEFNPEGTGGNAATLAGLGQADGTGVGVIGQVAGLFKSLAGAVKVQITVTEASNIGTGATLKLGVFYVLD